MGLFFNTKCWCGRPRGCCPHTSPNLSDAAREKHTERVERKLARKTTTKRKKRQ